MLNTFLNNPFDKEKLSVIWYIFARTYFYISFSLIAITPILFFIETNSLYEYVGQTSLSIISKLTLYFFTLDLILQFISAPKKVNYVFSMNGAIDILAVIPSWISIIFGLGFNSSVLRILRLLRIGKLFNNLPKNSFLAGFRGKLIMITIGILGIKFLIMSFENHPSYPKFENINIILGLVTFSLAMLLGTKLSVLNNRMYTIEDSLCRCVGSLKIFWEKDPNIQPNLIDWSKTLLETIKNPHKEKINSMRKKNNALYQILALNHDGPNLTNFARDIAYILHRATASSPFAYENLLRDIVGVFTLVILLVIPGLTGLVSILVLSYVFFGMFLLVDDMDRPLDFSDGSLITANLEPLEEFIDGK